MDNSRLYGISWHEPHFILGIEGGRGCPKGTDRERGRGGKEREREREREREGDILGGREKEREREMERERAGGRKTHSRRPFIFGNHCRLFLALFHNLQFCKQIDIMLNTIDLK
jgi:hypothetical protein